MPVVPQPIEATFRALADLRVLFEMFTESPTVERETALVNSLQQFRWQVEQGQLEVIQVRRSPARRNPQ